MRAIFKNAKLLEEAEQSRAIKKITSESGLGSFYDDTIELLPKASPESRYKAHHVAKRVAMFLDVSLIDACEYLENENWENVAFPIEQ